MVDCIQGFARRPWTSSRSPCHLLSVFHLCRNLNVDSGFWGHQDVSKGKMYTYGDVKSDIS